MNILLLKKRITDKVIPFMRLTEVITLGSGLVRANHLHWPASTAPPPPTLGFFCIFQRRGLSRKGSVKERKESGLKCLGRGRIKGYCQERGTTFGPPPQAPGNISQVAINDLLTWKSH